MPVVSLLPNRRSLLVSAASGSAACLFFAHIGAGDTPARQPLRVAQGFPNVRSIRPAAVRADIAKALRLVEPSAVRAQDELNQTGRSCAAPPYANPVDDNRLDKGRRFAAWELPQISADEMQAALRPLGRGADIGA
jgi:hypothetical protein